MWFCLCCEWVGTSKKGEVFVCWWVGTSTKGEYGVWLCVVSGWLPLRRVRFVLWLGGYL